MYFSYQIQQMVGRPYIIRNEFTFNSEFHIGKGNNSTSSCIFCALKHNMILRNWYKSWFSL